MAIPLPPGSKPYPTAKLTQDEVTTILNTTLLDQHRDDPNVINFIKNFLYYRSVSDAARLSGIQPLDARALYNRPDIYQAIRKITDKAVLRYGYDAEEVVERVKEVMNTDPAAMQNEDGTFKESLHDVPADVRRGIKKFKAKNYYEYDPNGVKVYAGKIIEVEYWDKMKAVELLGREKEIFKETKVHQHDIGKNMSSVLLESKRLAEQETREIKDVTSTETFAAQITHSGTKVDATDGEAGT